MDTTSDRHSDHHHDLCRISVGFLSDLCPTKNCLLLYYEESQADSSGGSCLDDETSPAKYRYSNIRANKAVTLAVEKSEASMDATVVGAASIYRALRN